ncbi:uncharacterized protein NPIL_550871 [Nephila pilipes]|uniref:Uncharacterized protein n=1 Tax=Nephila pilipes TaxID=299642 RepID=A0A8X6N980_NEPPI|nr:uncharacterized protein NPIL_550871 [Nephila pilipes]
MDAANQALLERTKKVRGNSRSIMTKQSNKLETIIHENYLQLITRFEELSRFDKEIESLIGTDDLEDEFETREEYRDKFILWKARADSYIEYLQLFEIQQKLNYKKCNTSFK